MVLDFSRSLNNCFFPSTSGTIHFDHGLWRLHISHDINLFTNSRSQPVLFHTISFILNADFVIFMYFTYLYLINVFILIDRSVMFYTHEDTIIFFFLLNVYILHVAHADFDIIIIISIIWVVILFFLRK